MPSIFLFRMAYFFTGCELDRYADSARPPPLNGCDVARFTVPLVESSMRV
jgi:hypothetical protein